MITFDHVIEGSFSVEVKDSHARGGRGYSIVPRPDATGAIAPIDLKVRLSVTGSVRGHFYKPDGVTPVPFGIIRLTSNYYQIGQSGTSGLGDVGSFSFDFVPAGTVRVYAEDPLTGRTGIAVGTIDTEGQVLELKPIAQGLGTVQGVVTSNGAPQPGAHVDIVSGTFRAATMSDADGAYLLPGVPEGRVVATASFDFGFLSGTASQTLTGDGTVLTLDVPLHDSGTLTGVVFASDGVTAAPPSIVTLRAGGQGSASLTSSTDAAGGFRFDLVPAGLASITVDVLGSIDVGGASIEVARGGETQQSVVLNGVGSLSGSALDSLGHPVEGDLKIVGTGAFPYTLSVHVNPDGQFRFPELLAGPFTAQLQASAGSLVLFGSAAGTVTPNAEATITVQLQDSGTITGTRRWRGRRTITS